MSLKRLLVLAVGVCLIFSLSLVFADQKEDEATIKKVVVDIFDTWNAKDGKGMAAHFEDGTINFLGAGKSKDFENAANNRRPDNKAKLIEEMGVVFLTPDVAIERRITEYSAATLPDGKTSLVWNRTASVLMKKNGKWIIVAQFARPMTDEEIREMKQTEN